MEDLYEKVKSNIIKKKLIDSKDKVIIGVSGGPDSIFLLNVLHKMKKEQVINFEIEIAHINHLIRKQAMTDEVLVKNVAQDMGYKIHVLSIDVPLKAKEQKISEEECGRNIRYEYFEKLLKEHKANKIVVAHNQNDNIETVMMNFIRGTGINGLTGMKYVYGHIIRPILDIKKQDILEYLDENNICYVIDKSNMENKYTRNRIRNDLIKKIEQDYNPNFTNVIQRMIELNRQDEILINDCVEKEVEKIDLVVGVDKIIINSSNFYNMSKAIKYRIIRKILTQLIGNIQGIEKIHIEDIDTLITKNIVNKKYIIGSKFTVTIAKENIVKFELNSFK